jgi:dipeptide/tripeptide permease
MWERFSFYGMRAILQLFLTAPLAVGGVAICDSGACEATRGQRSLNPGAANCC